MRIDIGEIFSNFEDLEKVLWMRLGEYRGEGQES